MKFEHFAINVPDTRATVRWYQDNLGLRIARTRAEDPYTTFLADDTGRIIIELYSNTKATYPDWPTMHPLNFHIAFVSEDPIADAKRLVAAGGTPFSEETMPDDDGARPVGRVPAVREARYAFPGDPRQVISQVSKKITKSPRRHSSVPRIPLS